MGGSPIARWFAGIFSLVDSHPIGRLKCGGIDQRSVYDTGLLPEQGMKGDSSGSFGMVERERFDFSLVVGGYRFGCHAFLVSSPSTKFKGGIQGGFE